MLEKLILIFFVFNLFIALVAKLINPSTDAYYRQKEAAHTIPYDPVDFGAFCSYMALREFEEGGARFLFDCDVPGMEKPADMIMLSKSGIYVFEHSMANGIVNGSEQNELWTQKVQRGYGRMPQESKIPNPVWAAEGKVRALREYAKLENVPIRSMVVFSDYCLLNNIKVMNPNVRVVVLGQLFPAMMNLNGRRGNYLTQREISDLFEDLAQYELLPQEETEDEKRKSYE